MNLCFILYAYYFIMFYKNINEFHDNLANLTVFVLTLTILLF